MLNVASTESFEVVREQFFKSYISKAVSSGPKTMPTPSPLHNGSIQASEPILPLWRQAARNFSGILSGVCKKYVGSGLADDNERIKQIEAILQKPGTPYEKVGFVLAWFKEWRLEKREQAGRHPQNAFDTQHDKLQDGMTQLVLDISYAMIASDKHAPPQALHVLRSQPKNAFGNDPVPELSRPSQSCNYTNYTGKLHRRAEQQENRDKWIVNSKKYREQLEHASPWTIVIDWDWKKNLCFPEGQTVNSRSVPPLYTLGKYLLVADETTWNRQYVCDALVVEKTLISSGEFQSGLDLGLAARPRMDVAAYEAWWKEQERSSAKDWRYIRRSSVMLMRIRTNSMNNITVGDAVARLKKFGPGEVVNGAFAYEEADIKELLLERIQPDLGKKFSTLKKLEEALGHMPDVIIETLTSSLKNEKMVHPEPESSMNHLFE